MRVHSKSRQSGASLLEIVLVLAVGTMIIVLALKQYQIIKRDADIQQTHANVSKLFQSAAEYYMANCKRLFDTSTGPIAGTGTLDPANAPPNPFPLTIGQLALAGYFADTLPRTDVVADAGAEPDYVVQFNMADPPKDREISISGQTDKAKLGEIIAYTIQISVLLRDPILARAYGQLLDAQCLSTLATNAGGNYVVPCKSVGVPPVPVAGAKIYAVFERLPSYAVPNAQSDFWVSTPTVKEFNQLYETKNVNYLTTIDSGSYPQQYYLCGS